MKLATWCEYKLEVQEELREILKLVFVMLDFDSGRDVFQKILDTTHTTELKDPQ